MSVRDNRIRFALARRNATNLAELASDLCVTRSTLQRKLITGESPMTNVDVLALASVIGMSRDDIDLPLIVSGREVAKAIRRFRMTVTTEDLVAAVGDECAQAVLQSGAVSINDNGIIVPVGR